MPSYRTRLTSKGQITIPIEVRTRLGLRQGDEVEFEVGKAQTVLRPVRGVENPFAAWVGIAKGAFPRGLKNTQEWIREMRGGSED